MKFLSVILLIAFYKNWPSGNLLREKFPLSSWFSWVAGRVQGENLRIFLSVLLPSALVFLISLQLSGFILGFFWLVLSLAVLAYGVVIIDTDIIFDDQVLWLRGIREGDDLAEAHQAQSNFCGDVIYDVFQNLVPVLFWFLILGPAGALFFILCQNYLDWMDEEGVESDFLEVSLYWMEWIPSRLTVFLFALLGDFGRTYQVFMTSVFDIETSVSTTLYESARCAVGGAETAVSDYEEFASATETGLQELKLLLERSLWGWIGIAALLTIFGL